MTEPVQYQGRAILYKIALKGVLVKPIFGYGGPQFKSNWMNLLNKTELLEFFQGFYSLKFTKVLQGFDVETIVFKDIKIIQDQESGNTLFQTRDKNNKVGFTSVDLWKAHNQFLDIALMWGLVGLALYITLITFSFKNLFKFDFFALAIFALRSCRA